MASTEGGGTERRPGRPRSERADRAILDAARALLTERRPREVTMEAIAERAGVGKATLYRRWSSREELALGLLEEITAGALPVDDMGDTRAELVALVRQTIAALSGSAMGPVVQGLVSELIGDPELRASMQERVISVRRQAVRDVLDRALARGDVRADLDVEIGAELLVGPVYYRLLVSGEPLDDGLAERVVDSLMTGWRAARRATAPAAQTESQHTPNAPNTSG
jgi:AcrR family transcriptional regulator